MKKQIVVALIFLLGASSANCVNKIIQINNNTNRTADVELRNPRQALSYTISIAPKSSQNLTVQQGFKPTTITVYESSIDINKRKVKTLRALYSETILLDNVQAINIEPDPNDPDAAIINIQKIA